MVVLSANMKTPHGEGESFPVAWQFGRVPNEGQSMLKAQLTSERSKNVPTRFLLRGGEGQVEGEPFNQLHHFLI